MESCHLCLGPLEGTKTLCQDCIRSNQEACKHTIREKKAILHLLHQEQRVLARKVKEIVESNTEQRRISDANLQAAKLKSLNDATLKYEQEIVKKEEQKVEALRESITQRRAALSKAKEMLSVVQKKLEEQKKNDQTATTTTTTTTSTSLTSSSSSSNTSNTRSSSSSSSSPHRSSKTPTAVSPPSRSSNSSHHSHSSHSSRQSHSSHSSHSHSHSSHSSHSHSSHSHLSHSSSHSSSPLIKTPSSQSSSSSPLVKSPSSHVQSPSRPLSSSSSSLSSSALQVREVSVEARLQATRQKLAQARRSLASELLSFFPINPSPTASETETVIMNVTMPNNGRYEAYRPDALSAALGYVAHVVYLLASYLGVILPWKIDFAGAMTHIWSPFENKRLPLFGSRYSEIEPGLSLLNNDIVYLCGSQGVHVPPSAQHSTLPNLLLLLRSPTLGIPGPIEAFRNERLIQVSRPLLRVTEPPSPVMIHISEKERQKLKAKEKDKTKEEGEEEEEEDEDDDFIVLDHPTIPTPEQTEELAQFECAMFIDTS